MAYLAEREGARTQFLPSLVQPISPRHDSRALSTLVGVVRRFRPDVVHTHTAKAGFVGRAAALALWPRPAIVHTYHGHVLEGYFGPAKTTAYRTLERWMARISDSLVGVSEATVEDLVGFGVASGERFRVIPLGLDLAPFADLDGRDGTALRQELSVGDKEVLLAFIGRVVPIKRVDRLLRSVSLARAKGAPVRLAIIGDGEIRPSLEGLAHELGISESVHFLGYRRELPRILAAADMAVLSSDNEGTPVSLIEAAAAGRPAVATNVGGVPEVVTNETGILVSPADERGLSDAIVRLAADPGLRRHMGERARKRALDRYSVDRLLADIARLYAELLQARDLSRR